MSMLKNISNTEIAGILSGDLPNPVVDAPPSIPCSSPTSGPPTSSTSSSSQSSMTTTTPNSNKTGATTPVNTNMGAAGSNSGSISAYQHTMHQHTMHTLLRRQLSSKRKSNRRSLPNTAIETPPTNPTTTTSNTPTPTTTTTTTNSSNSRSGSIIASNNSSEADKDVVEIDLDSSNDSNIQSMTTEQQQQQQQQQHNQHHFMEGLQTPVYPALLLNASAQQHDSEEDIISNYPYYSHDHYYHSQHPLASNGNTSAPELTRWERDIQSDYFVHDHSKFLFISFLW